jgi:dTDP-4-amino-4,6-dideoxygalactose transaminase
VKAITPKTKAIIPVHLGSNMADMDLIMELAEKHNLIVIEDCAHAHGAKWRGRGAGTIGHFGSFSMQSSKTLTSGEGGILLCRTPELAAKAASIIDCGRPHALGGGEEDSNGFSMQGSNYRLSELQAALALVGIERFPAQAKKREEMAAYMDEALSEIPGVRVMKRDERHTTRSFYRYVFAIDPKQFGVEHDVLCGALDAEGISCWTGYEAMNNYELFQPQKSTLAVPNAFPEYFKFKEMYLPEAERACEHEAVWLDENIFRTGPEGVDDAVAAIKKIQRNSKELNAASAELRERYGK